MNRGTQLIILCLLAVPAYAQIEQSSAVDDRRILVTFADPGAARINLSGRPGPGYRRRATYFASFGAEKAANRIADDFQLERLDDWLIRPLNLFCLVYAVPEKVGVVELLEQLRARPEVESAQTLNDFELMTDNSRELNDPYSNLQYVVDTLELLMAHTWSTGGGVNIAVIDTGADFNHTDLETQISSHRNFVDDQDTDFTEDMHGTAVAGVIAAASGNGFGIIGVAPAAKMSVLKACWYMAGKPDAVCNSFTIAKALSYAIEEQADIINLSLGGPVDSLLSRLVAEAQRRGAIVVGAAPGNGKRGFPANVRGVIVVDRSTALTHLDRHDSSAVYAPGDDILVATPHGGFDYSSGSSLAAAHVTGVVALLVALQPTLSLEEINALIATSQATSGGSINACRAVAQLIGESGCRSLQSASHTN